MWARPNFSYLISHTQLETSNLIFSLRPFTQVFAASIAVNPKLPAHSPALPESLTDYKASFHLFHGAQGIVPLVRAMDRPVAQPELKQCPFHRLGRREEGLTSVEKRESQASKILLLPQTPSATRSPVASAQFASASSGVFRFLVSLLQNASR